MSDRWATFDCYGTLVDWRARIRASLSRLWPEVDADALLTLYHQLEPAIQAGRGLAYRDVMAETLAAVAGLRPRSPAARGGGARLLAAAVAGLRRGARRADRTKASMIPAHLPMGVVGGESATTSCSALSAGWTAARPHRAQTRA